MLNHKLLIFGFLILNMGVYAQHKPVFLNQGFKEKTPNIIKISSDSILIAKGQTYSYTVDTPEEKGLLSTYMPVKQFLHYLTTNNSTPYTFRIVDSLNNFKNEGKISNGDQLQISNAAQHVIKNYNLVYKKGALSGKLSLHPKKLSLNTPQTLSLQFTAGQRSPNTEVNFLIPKGIHITLENTTVNVIGRGEVKLKNLSKQSIGRAGAAYPYQQVGEVFLTQQENGNTQLTFKNLDLRPSNGVDLEIKIHNVLLKDVEDYHFKAQYTTAEPQQLKSPATGPEKATLKAVKSITDFRRILKTNAEEAFNNPTMVTLQWSPLINNKNLQLAQSLDQGKTWEVIQTIKNKSGTITLEDISPDTLFMYRLQSLSANNSSISNPVYYYSGKIDIQKFGAVGSGKNDDSQIINTAIDSINKLGGGILRFSSGTYLVKTIHLKSNVWLYLDKEATIKALKGSDAPAPTWFSDKQYRSGLSPTDEGPYVNPENWLTKQDVGHTFFRNTMFFGQRLNNVKIIGNGRITGDGNLNTSDKVMNKPHGNRADKMFTFKLCTNIEIGGLHKNLDLWYDLKKDTPYYINHDLTKDYNLDNMLHIDQGGHFVVLATGSDDIKVHDTYFGKASGSNARDIYDFMSCKNVKVTNIYSKISSDDMVKLGSDVSLGFTRSAGNYYIRNIIGDTNCNLFQIGSETSDDIQNVHVDNIFVTGANKAGFSISTNDGGHIKNIHLNCGHTGSLHSRSKMYRTRAPFFISISNRGRTLGATAKRYKFTENGKKHDELLNTNINIGQVENVVINGVDIYEVYGGSSYRHKDVRWTPYDGSQGKATPIVAGYALPKSNVVEGGLDFKLPNGKHTGYIQNISFNDVHVLVKGENPSSDSYNTPPELGVGQYNVKNLGIQPSYGLWVRHAKNLKVNQSTFNYEQKDSRFAIFLDDVKGGMLTNLKMTKAQDSPGVIGLKNADNISVQNCLYFSNKKKIRAVPIKDVHLSTTENITNIPSEN